MVKQLFYMLLFLFNVSISAQEEIHSNLISTQGIYQENGISLQWSIGEPVINQFSSAEFDLNIGFLQPQLRLVSISEVSNHFDVKVFPNPAVKFIQINFESAFDVNLNIFNVNGKLVLKHGLINSGELIEVQSFSDGMYIIKLNYLGKNSSHPIIKTTL